MKPVTLYDTTLRDGTQGTGISFSTLDKLRIAERLDDFGIDYIEGGWPGSNPKDAAFFEQAASRPWKHAQIAAFGMTRRHGIPVEDDPQIRALLDAKTPVITIVGKTWDLHVAEVLRVTLEENLAMISETIRFLRENHRIVFYDAEHFFDGYRARPDYALATLAAARDAGASILVLCDTNGGSLPEFIAEATSAAATTGAPLGIHTHNDCGLAVANALAAVRAGAVQIQGTINGYGERVGNCNLTTTIPTLQLKMGIPCVENLAGLRDLSAFVDELANLPRDPRAPYVGDAAFAHKGGIHIHAVQKLARTYEHVPPESVGNRQVFIISDMSGQSNIIAKAASLGFHLEKGSPDAAKILQQVKDFEAKGYEFESAEASFELLLRRATGLYRPLFELKEYHCHFRRTREGSDPCEATVKLLVNNQPEYTVDEGDGPVNALDAALRKALRPFYPWIEKIRLADYKVRIIDSARGSAARTRVNIVSEADGHTWSTIGVSDNIIQASWLALVESFEYYANKFLPSAR